MALALTTAAVPASAAPSLVSSMTSGPFAAEASPSSTVNAPYERYAQNAISPSKAKSIAASRVPGAKFVDISRSGGQYRVRMLRKDGRVVDVLIDATTGRVLN